jgi:hypothetical protein
LIESTKDGVLIWTLRDSCFNSESRYGLHTFSIDKKTEFQIEINLDESLNSLKCHNCMWIYNTDLLDGKKYISSNVQTKILEQMVFDMFVKPTIKHKSKSQDSIYDDILNNIGDKQYNRDKKLQQLIEEKEKTDGFLKDFLNNIHILCNTIL